VTGFGLEPGVKLPRADKPRVQSLELDEVHRLADAMPQRTRATVGPPKTPPSHRTVPAQVTLDVLAAHLTRWPADQSGLVFTNMRGDPWLWRTFCALIRDAREVAGLRSSVTFHDPRHHFASVLIAADCSIKAVQEALGHANAGEDTEHVVQRSDQGKGGESPCMGATGAVLTPWRARVVVILTSVPVRVLWSPKQFAGSHPS